MTATFSVDTVAAHFHDETMDDNVAMAMTLHAFLTYLKRAYGLTASDLGTLSECEERLGIPMSERLVQWCVDCAGRGCATCAGTGDYR